jgi:hypothetical protein
MSKIDNRVEAIEGDGNPVCTRCKYRPLEIEVNADDPDAPPSLRPGLCIHEIHAIEMQHIGTDRDGDRVDVASGD